MCVLNLEDGRFPSCVVARGYPFSEVGAKDGEVGWCRLLCHEEREALRWVMVLSASVLSSASCMNKSSLPSAWARAMSARGCPVSAARASSSCVGWYSCWVLLLLLLLLVKVGSEIPRACDACEGPLACGREVGGWQASDVTPLLRGEEKTRERRGGAGGGVGDDRAAEAASK